MVHERYKSNVAAIGKDAYEKIREATITIHGNNQISQAVIFNLIGLGVRNIAHICNDDHMQDGILKSLATMLQYNGQAHDEFLFHISPEITYTQITKKQYEHDSSTRNHLHQYEIETASIQKRTYIDEKHEQNKKSFASLLEGTLIANEVYRAIITDNVQSQQPQQSQQIKLARHNRNTADISSTTRASLGEILHDATVSTIPRQYNRVAIVGAGGLGTYCTYVLAQQAYERGIKEIIICDPDAVEEKNLNRQLFYLNNVGEAKADVLAKCMTTLLQTEKLQKQAISKNQEYREAPQINSRRELFTTAFDARCKLDALFCCTDTIESRIAASDYAQQHNIPLVEGACTASMGSIATYVPNKTKTVAQQRDLHAHLQLEKQKQNVQQKKHEQREQNELADTRNEIQESSSCARVANPSIICPNILIGATQAIVLDEKIDSNGNSIDEYPQIFLNLQSAKDKRKFTQSRWERT